MSYKGETAFLTGMESLPSTYTTFQCPEANSKQGGASGIGRAVTTMLAGKGIKVYVADRDITGARALADSLNASSDGQIVWPVEVDVADWDSQRRAFEAAVSEFKRIDYVLPIAGIGERRSFPHPKPGSTGFEKPDLSVMEIDGIGPIYTVSLAVQHFRRQGLNKYGFRGKIVAVASVCGFYIHETIPVYTAAKHAVVGFVRSFGKILAEEHITLNAVCPNKIRTAIGAEATYKKAEAAGVLVPMEHLLQAFELLLGDNDASGECFEVAPKIGVQIMPKQAFVNEESRISAEMTYERSHHLHEPVEPVKGEEVW